LVPILVYVDLAIIYLLCKALLYNRRATIDLSLDVSMKLKRNASGGMLSQMRTLGSE